MKHQRQKKLKTNIPKSPQEWLEYQEHRDRWTPETRRIIDQRIKDAFPVKPEDEETVRRIRRTQPIWH